MVNFYVGASHSHYPVYNASSSQYLDPSTLPPDPGCSVGKPTAAVAYGSYFELMFYKFVANGHTGIDEHFGSHEMRDEDIPPQSSTSTLDMRVVLCVVPFFITAKQKLSRCINDGK